MIEAIDSALKTSTGAFSPAHTGVNTQAQSAAAHATAKTSGGKDSVALSVVAQAKLLEQQGKTVNEIAETLAISKSVVLEDLGLANASIQAASAAATAAS